MLDSEKIRDCAAVVRRAAGERFRPRVGIVLGTGLGAISGRLEEAVSVPYSALPGYPASTVDSHSGRFSLGRLLGREVILQEGRCHLYEGYSPEEVALGVRIMAELGAEILIVTNAAGGLDPAFRAGSALVITDQINFTGQSPLTGVGDLPGRSRFADMSAVYDPELIGLAEAAAGRLGLKLERGVYLGLRGPQMETRAETRMFRLWGADAVGMSTVIEVIAARHLGLRVLGLSALSNVNIPESMAPVPIEEVIEVSGRAAGSLERIILAVLENI